MTANVQQHAPRVRDRKSAPKAPRVNLGSTSMERAARVAAVGIVPVRVPAIPPSNPDADILNGYAEAMTLRAAGYAAGTEPDDEQAQAESRVWCGRPATVAGVVARMALKVTEADDNRWVDELLSNSGVGAVIARKLCLNDDGRHLAQDIESLIRIDWEQAVAAYEAEELALSNILAIKDAIENQRASIPEAVYARLIDAVELAEERHFKAEAGLARLMGTMAPDGPALQAKVRIAGDEAQFEVVGTVDYINRDFMYVMGRYADAPVES